MIYFISGHRDITEAEFAEHYIPKIKHALGDPSAKFVIGECDGVDTMARNYLYNKTGFETVTIYHRANSDVTHIPEWPLQVVNGGHIKRDTIMTSNSNFDIAWVRNWNYDSGTRQNILRRNALTNLEQGLKIIK